MSDILVRSSLHLKQHIVNNVDSHQQRLEMRNTQKCSDHCLVIITNLVQGPNVIQS
jgi:hypothetical protein